MNEGADGDLGALVAVLDGNGLFDQADLIESGWLSYEQQADGPYDGPPTFVAAFLAVDPLHYPMLSPEAITVMREAIEVMHSSTWIYIREFKARPMRVGADWRELRRAARLPPESRTATNQGGYKPVTALKREDGLNFGSDQEVDVYRALRAKQKALPPEMTIGIMPGGAIVTSAAKFWPDFVVTYRGRAGGIEVDGPHHHGRAAADRSRENLLTDAGLVWGDRITVEDVARPAELSAFVERFLTRLLR